MFGPFVIAGHDGTLVVLQFHFDVIQGGVCQVKLTARAARSLAADLTRIAERLDTGETRVDLADEEPPFVGGD